MLHRLGLFAVFLIAFAAAIGCEDGGSEAPEGAEPAPLVEPPFTIRSEAEDLLFTYFDAEGAHTVDRLAEVPEAHREQVAVRSLTLAPAARPAPGRVFVADLRAPGPDGRYPVRLVSRDDFDRRVDEAMGRGASPAVASATGDVVLYGASWCGACRSAAAFLRSQGVAFQERDIERDDAAREEMLQKLRARGMPAGGIPVIDFRGTLVQGFDRPALEGLIGGSARPI